METFGEYLKAQREKKSIRLEEIASITKIHLHSLELLESNEWDQLPPEPFIRGFILAYAKYVGLDPKEALGRYHEAMGRRREDLTGTDLPPATPRMTQESPSDVIQSPRHLPWNKIFGALGAAAVIAIVATFIYVGRSNSEPRDLAEAPVAIVNEAAPTPMESAAPPLVDANAAAAIAAASPTPTSQAEESTHQEKVAMVPAPVPVSPIAAGAPVAVTVNAEAPKPSEIPPPPSEVKHEVTVEGKDVTWIKVVIDDNKPTQSFLPKGEKVTFQAKNKLKIVLGNSSGAKVTHNGEEAKGKKFQGTIRSYLFPENARFPQDPGTKRNVAAKSEGGDEKPAEGSEKTSDGESKPD